MTKNQNYPRNLKFSQFSVYYSESSKTKFAFFGQIFIILTLLQKQAVILTETYSVPITAIFTGIGPYFSVWIFIIICTFVFFSI